MAVIAMSRQVGSFGEEIASLVADRLGYRIADREMIHKLADSCDPGFKKACSLYEREVPKGFWARHFFNDLAYASLFEALNFELASQGNMVIMGRGAQIVLGETPGVFKVRIVAPYIIRARRLMEREGLSLAEAEEFVHRYGHDRRALIQQIYHKDLADWALYDLIMNTTSMTPEGGAAIICQAVEGMAPLADPEAWSDEMQRISFSKLVESAIRKKVSAASYRNIYVSSPVLGKVILDGYVMDSVSKDEAERIATEFEGVKEVDNQLRTTTLSF